MGGLYFDKNNNLVFSGITTEYVLCADVMVIPTPSITPSITSTPSLTPSETPSKTPSETPSETPTLTPTPSSSEIPISTPSMTPTPTIPAPIGFKTEWTTTGSNETITLPFTDNGTYNATVDWGDGSSVSTITTYNDADATHNYVVAGVYNVEIKGEAPGWSMGGGFPDASKCTNIIDWGNASGFGGFSYLAEGFVYSAIKSTGIGKLQAKNDLLYLSGLFLFCGSLTGITAGIFDNCVNVTQMGNTFTYTLITGVPPDLFKYMTALTDIYNLFEGCPYMTSSGFQSNMFNSLTGLTSVSGTFKGVSFTYIPDDLFKYNTKVSNFTTTFQGCTSLTGITDANMFNWTTEANIYPAAIFNGCSSLEVIPNGLFLNPGFKEMNNIFLNCDKLQLNPWTFYLNSGDTATRFLDKNIQFADSFKRTTFTGVQGTAPDLWNCNFGTGSVYSVGTFGGTGNDLTSISNYGDIPAGWL